MKDPNPSSFIGNKKDFANLIEKLSELPGTGFNSLLMQVFRKRALDIKAPELLQQITNNRFCKPADVDAIMYKELELNWLKHAQEKGFMPVILSPLAPFGTCSAVGEVDQNNVVSALRNAEIVSDATNYLALIIAAETKKQAQKKDIKYSTVHRLVRAQAFANPAFSAHFGLFGIATGGFDTGSCNFEINNLFDHIQLHADLLTRYFQKEDLSIKLEVYDNEVLVDRIRKSIDEMANNHNMQLNHFPKTGDYYQSLRFKIFLHYKNNEINLSDGGIVDWTQKLISNKKHRLMISGTGLELVCKLVCGVI